MSLATRCPKCNTVFQVNEEQLKRFSGVVRCGVCQTPFNGIDHLIGRLSHNSQSLSASRAEDINVASLSIDNTEAQKTSPLPDDRQSVKQSLISRLEHKSETIDIDKETTTTDDVKMAREEALKASFEKQIRSISFDLNLALADEDKPTSAEIQHNISSASDYPGKITESKPIQTNPAISKPFLSPEPVTANTAIYATTDSSIDPIDKTASTEELVKIIQRKRKRSFFSQFLWSMGTLVLLTLLGAQGIYRYSEEIIAWWPPAQELVATTCELLDCPIETPVRKPPLSVETTPPEKLENVPDQFIQNITLTNNSQDTQVWPSLVLELTDSGDEIVIRRIFAPEEYLPEEAGMLKGLQPASGITFRLTYEFAHQSAVTSRISLLNPS